LKSATYCTFLHRNCGHRMKYLHLSILLLCCFTIINADESVRVIEFRNFCETPIDIVSTITPFPENVPPGDPVCYASEATCKQPGSASGGCHCSAAVIASLNSRETTQWKEQLMMVNGQWTRGSVNYRPDFVNVYPWSEGAPAEFTFIEIVDYYDISMIPPGCRSGHWNQFENDYCFGDADGPKVDHIGLFNTQDCWTKGDPISPGFAGLPAPSEGYYCGMPTSFDFSYNGQRLTIFPVRKVGIDSWFAAKDLTLPLTPENTNNMQFWSDEIKDAAFDYIRAELYQCCYAQAVALRGDEATPGIYRSFTIQAMATPTTTYSECEDRVCLIRNPNADPTTWVTTDGCQKGYQYPFDDFYSTQLCTPPAVPSSDLGVSAKTYRVTYCPENEFLFVGNFTRKQ